MKRPSLHKSNTVHLPLPGPQLGLPRTLPYTDRDISICNFKCLKLSSAVLFAGMDKERNVQRSLQSILLHLIHFHKDIDRRGSVVPENLCSFCDLSFSNETRRRLVFSRHQVLFCYIPSVSVISVTSQPRYHQLVLFFFPSPASTAFHHYPTHLHTESAHTCFTEICL